MCIAPYHEEGEGILKSTMSRCSRALKGFFVALFFLALFAGAPGALAAHPNVATPYNATWAISGSEWGGITHFIYTSPFVDSTPGTYYVRAWAVDARGNWSISPSATLPVTLAFPSIQATCVVDPTSGLTTDTFTWRPLNVSGGSGSYSYTFSGGPTIADGLSYGSPGTPTYLIGATSISKTYSTAGTKTATVTVTSGGASQDFPCPDVVVGTPAPDLTANSTSISLQNGSLAAVSTTDTSTSMHFAANITNIGTASASNFPNVFQVQKADASDPSGYVTIERVLPYGNPMGTVAAMATQGIAKSSYLFTTTGTYRVRACAGMDTSGNIVVTNESNTNNNCDTWQDITVSPPPQPSGTLTVPTSCTVSANASTCVVSASWTTANVTGAYLYDANVGTTTWTGNNSITPKQVYVAYGGTTFNLKNGDGTVLNTKTVAAACALGSTWNGTKCLANVSIGAFSPTSASVTSGGSTMLNWSGVTGGGTITCTIDNGVGAATPVASGSKSTGVLTTGKTFTLTCSNAVSTASKSATVTVGAPPVNGACSVSHYACSSGNSINNAEGTDAYTWSCRGINGGTDDACSESKNVTTNTPRGALIIPDCTISVGASTCISEASWDLTNTTDAYLFDANPYGSGTLYGKGVGYIPGIPSWNGTLSDGHIDPPVYVAYPSTAFNLNNGDGTTLASQTVLAGCAPGSTWNGSVCVADVYACTGAVPANASAYPAPDNTGLTQNTAYAYAVTNTANKCEFKCNSSYTWNGSACVANALNVSCVGSPSNPYIGQQVTWTSSVAGGSGLYTYSWSGEEALSGSTATLHKTYVSAGVKHAVVLITDTTTGATGSVSCTTGVAQPNGPSITSTGGVGVSVGSCVATLTANPSSVEQGNGTSFTWSVTGGSLCASSCSGSGFDTGGNISGTGIPNNDVSLPQSPSSSYALTCVAGTYGPPAPVTTTVTVTIPAPVVTVNNQSPGSGNVTNGPTGSSTNGAVLVDPSVPNNVVIAWAPPVVYSRFGYTCTAYKNGVAWNPPNLNSSGTTDTVTTKTTYMVDCENNTTHKHSTTTILVNVLLNYQEF